MPRQSLNTRLRMTAQGFTISGVNRSKSFAHPWQPSLSGLSLRLSRGLVNGLEPLIGKVPVSGDEKHAAPALKLSASEIDAETQQSWVGVQVVPDADGNLLAQEQLSLVHGPLAYAFAGFRGRQPLVMILWRAGKPVRAVSVAWFNMRYVSLPPVPGHGGRRHFFL